MVKRKKGWIRTPDGWLTWKGQSKLVFTAVITPSETWIPAQKRAALKRLHDAADQASPDGADVEIFYAHKG
jgi:hypothetical protein